MHSLFVALGPVVRKLAHRNPIELLDLPRDCHHRKVRHADDFLGIVCTPRGVEPLVATKPELNSTLLVDGYIVNDSNKSSNTQSEVEKLLQCAIVDGSLEIALNRCSAGSFNLAFENGRTREFAVYSDRIGSIPLYYSELPDGYILSTSSHALVRTGLVSTELDWTACASWIYFGYPLCNRHILRDIKLFPSHTALRWTEGRGVMVPLDENPLFRAPSSERTSVSAMATLIRSSCRRVANLATPIAHLQSAGMDSRLILAALPKTSRPACFTYGRAGSTEVPIAEQVAQTRGVPFRHFLPHGDVVAESLDSIFRATGLMVYPDRYLIARQMANEGYRSVLDGFAGDFLLGGIFYSNDRRFGLVSQLARLATIYRDQSISRLGMERIVQGIFLQISEVRELAGPLPFLSSDFVQQIELQRGALLEDIQAECQRVNGNNDSVGILFRRFLMQNRSRQAIAQQGVLCRQFLQVLLPFTNDRDVLDACLGLKPEIVAYRRFYIRMFVEEFPEYADIAYGDSMIPLKRSPWMHNYCKLLAKRSAKYRFLRHLISHVPVSPNNWSTWLQESALLRETLQTSLTGDGVTDPLKLERYLAGVASGELSGSGKLFHLAAIARWIKQSDFHELRKD